MRASRLALTILALCFIGFVALFSGGFAALGQTAASFAAFLDALWPEAAHEGITRPTFDVAFAGLTPDPNVLAAMRREPEYGKPMGAYLAGLVSPARIGMGQRKSAQWADTLRSVQNKYGVDQAILVSIWGIESSFGAGAQPWDVFRSIATLAQAGFQQPLFHDEMLSALRILQDGHIARREFVGSWAGAMGQPQFLPSSYLKYAVDFDGDGKADIWRSVPDVLASIANYLQKTGWQPGVPWGFEVVVPASFDYRLSRGTFGEWTQRGVQRPDGRPCPPSAKRSCSSRLAPQVRLFWSPIISLCLSASTTQTPMRSRSPCSPTACAACRAFSLPGRRTMCSPRAGSASRSSIG